MIFWRNTKKNIFRSTPSSLKSWIRPCLCTHCIRLHVVLI
jgi:hypothetical protein